jgi:hypothetical protein
MLIYWIAALWPYAVLGAIIGGLLNIPVWIVARRARQWGQRSTMPVQWWLLPVVGAAVAVLWGILQT